MITVEEAGALGEAVKVTLALHVGLQGLLEKADAVTPVGRLDKIVKVSGAVVPASRVAVAVTATPGPPESSDKVEGVVARLKSKAAAGKTSE